MTGPRRFGATTGLLLGFWLLLPARAQESAEAPAASGPQAATRTSDAASGGATPAKTLPAPPLELQPYRVQIQFACELGAANALPREQELAQEIRGLLSGQVGAFWEIMFAAGSESWLLSPHDVSRISEQDLAGHHQPGEDKIFVLGVVRTTGGLVAHAREWDASTQTLGPLQTRQTADDRSSANLAVAALHAAFRPLVQIEQDKQGVLTLRGRAALVSPHDASWSPLRTGAVFEPYYRYLNKERRVEKIQRIPWTYLVAGELFPEEGHARGEPLSGLRTAISARRRRIEAVALGVRLHEVATTVQLKTRPPASREIIGAEVQIRHERLIPATPEGEAPAAPLARLVSDRRGRFVVPHELAEPGKPLWLFVFSGSQMLGRVPFVPGIRELEVLELADDSLRLQVEGEIALLQAQLVDLAAQRAVMMALVRKRATAKDFTAAADLMKKLEETARPSTLLAELNTVRLPALKAAREQRDRATEARIKKLGDDTAEIINAHFSNEKIVELKEEVQELKEVAEDEAAGRPKRESTRKKPSGGKTKGAKKKAANSGEPPPPAAAPSAG